MICSRTNCIFSRPIKLPDGSSTPCCHFIIDTKTPVREYKDYEKGTCSAFTYANKRDKQKYLKGRWEIIGDTYDCTRNTFRKIQEKNNKRRVDIPIYGTKYVDKRNLGGVRRFTGHCPQVVEKIRHT